MTLQRVDSSTSNAQSYKGNDIDSDGDGIVDEADHAASADSAADADTLDGNDSAAFADSNHGHGHGDLSGISGNDHHEVFEPADYNPEADTHDRYADSEAVDAVDGSTLAAVAASDRLTIPVYATTGDVPAQPEGSIVYVSGDGLYVEDGT